MKIFTSLIVLAISLSSCYIFKYEENKEVAFELDNLGKSYYSKVIIYAMDSSRIRIDSTSPLGYNPNTPGNFVTEPNSRGVVLAFTLSQFKNTKKGLFEIHAKILNGKLIRQEFGQIDGLNTRKDFKIDLKDSTIIID